MAFVTRNPLQPAGARLGVLLRRHHVPKSFGRSLRSLWRVGARCNSSHAGDRVPPPLASFAAMKLHPVVQQRLREKAMVRPTPIQIQGSCSCPASLIAGLPVALSGRDMIGVACTGSGKTLVCPLTP